MAIHIPFFGCFKKLSKREGNIYRDGNEAGWTLILPHLFFWLEKTHMEWDRGRLGLGRVGDVFTNSNESDDIKII